MLSHFVAVYVPSTREGSESLSDTERVVILRKVASELSLKFGGCTAANGVGYWVSDVHGLIEESVTIVKSYYDESAIDTAAALDFARLIAANLKTELSQEAVTIETESGIEFI